MCLWWRPWEEVDDQIWTCSLWLLDCWRRINTSSVQQPPHSHQIKPPHLKERWRRCSVSCLLSICDGLSEQQNIHHTEMETKTTETNMSSSGFIRGRCICGTSTEPQPPHTRATRRKYNIIKSWPWTRCRIDVNNWRRLFQCLYDSKQQRHQHKGLCPQVRIYT